jgi:hypothetical protein
VVVRSNLTAQYLSNWKTRDFQTNLAEPFKSGDQWQFFSIAFLVYFNLSYYTCYSYYPKKILMFFVGLPHLATYIFLIFPWMYQNWVQESTLAWLFNPFPSSILDKMRQDLNPQPSDRESSPLTTRPDSRPILQKSWQHFSMKIWFNLSYFFSFIGCTSMPDDKTFWNVLWKKKSSVWQTMFDIGSDIINY